MRLEMGDLEPYNCRGTLATVDIDIDVDVHRGTPPVPPELVLDIMRHALPPSLDANAFRERYDLLLSFQLVCRSWAGLAQAELYRHVHLPTLAAIAFVKYSESVPSKWVDKLAPHSRYRLTKTLRLGGPQPAPHWGDADRHSFPTVSLWKVLAHCTKVKEISIVGIEISDYAELSVATGLVSLHLDNVSIRCIDQNLPYLPNLEYISVCRLATWTAKLHPVNEGVFMNPTCFPALKHLAWRWFSSVEEDDDDGVTTPSFGLLNSTLETIVLGHHTSEVASNILCDELSKATSLRHFALNNPEYLEVYLTHIPTHLHSLEMGVHYFRTEELDLDQDYVLQMLLDSSMESTSQLKRLSLPEVYLWGWRGRVRERKDPKQPALKEALELREEVRRVCEKRGIELVERELTEDGEDLPVAHWRECVEW